MKNVHSKANNAVTEVGNIFDIIAKINQSVKAISGHVGRKTVYKAGPSAMGASQTSNNIACINQAARQTSRVAGELRYIYSQFKV